RGEPRARRWTVGPVAQERGAAPVAPAQGPDAGATGGRGSTLRRSSALGHANPGERPTVPPVRLGERGAGPHVGVCRRRRGWVRRPVLGSASDKLGTHGVMLNLAVYGSFDLTDGVLMYLNQERRVTWGVGPFHFLRFRVDRSFADRPDASGNPSGYTFPS